jgi:hypothetical protein
MIDRHLYSEERDEEAIIQRNRQFEIASAELLRLLKEHHPERDPEKK